MKEQTQSNLIPALTILFFVFNLFLFVALQTPSGHFNPANILDKLDQEAMAKATAHDGVIVQSKPEMVLDWKLVDHYIDGDWRVEKYQEYEVYLDEKGKMVKELPTDHFNYLKYWRYR